MELWLMYMVNSNNNVANVNVVSPGYRSGSVNMNLSRRLKCYEFNYEGKCSIQVCQYSHLCIHCNGGHPMIFCQTGQFSTTVGFRQPWSLRQQFDLIQNYCIYVILVLGINNTTLDQDLQAQLWHLGFSPIKIDKLKEC